MKGGGAEGGFVIYGGPSVLNDLCYSFQPSAATVVVKAGKERDQRA